jgi:hypothetical protein
MFMQDIGSTADTELSGKDLALSWRELRVDILKALSVHWKLYFLPEGSRKMVSFALFHPA